VHRQSPNESCVLFTRGTDKVTRNPKELEEFMKRVPLDDVWLREHYPVQKHGFADAIHMHRELASPEMLDNMDGLLVVDVELDMSTKKKVCMHCYNTVIEDCFRVRGHTITQYSSAKEIRKSIVSTV